MQTLGPFKAGDVYRLRYGKVWATMLLTDELLQGMEDTAFEQLRKAMALPGLEQVIITPDVHTGYAVPIGFVGVSTTHLYPDTVGPDPACSVSLSKIACKYFERLDKPARRAIINELQEMISVSRRHRKDQVRKQRPPIEFEDLLEIITGGRPEKNLGGESPTA